MPPMRTGGRTAAGLLAILVLAIGACTSQAAEPPERADHATTSSTATSSTEPPPTTAPTRAFEPLLADPDLPLADQVEAAYLFHWEVLSEAGRTGDTSLLSLVFADEALELREGEVEGLRSHGVRMGGHVEHRYEVAVLDDHNAVVTDAYADFLSHLDPESGRPVASNNGELRLVEFHLKLIGESWRVTDVVLLEVS
jgi:hypothetical protein